MMKADRNQAVSEIIGDESRSMVGTANSVTIFYGSKTGNYGGKEMKTNRAKQERLIADYMEEFFAKVRITSRVKGRGNFYMASKPGCVGHFISEQVLLDQRKFRAETFDLIDKVMPHMSSSEYLVFVQRVRDASSVGQGW